jgi:putative cardiolipin synthase
VLPFDEAMAHLKRSVTTAYAGAGAGVVEKNVAALDAAIAGRENARPGASGFRLVADNIEAFALRLVSARMAGRSLDVQTYIWHADLTGAAIAQEVLAAADRGVRVRLLVDDMDARAKNAGYAAVAAHPNVQVRLFNPFASRSGTLSFVAEALGSFERINHRMHNKSWIADNRIALGGGRNLGDEYFGASEQVDFVDLDVAMVGPVVRDVSASFDRYWNSPLAYPIAVLDPEAVKAERLAALRGVLQQRRDEAARSRYAAALQSNDAIARLVSGEAPLRWSSRYSFAADDPMKLVLKEGDVERSQVIKVLAPVLEGTQREMTIISPYFVPAGATPMFVRSAQSGIEVRIITNSLAANDVAAVHGGYSRYRDALLDGGVELWELKPLVTRVSDASLVGSSGASLHTKALEVDGETLFVGSFNLDPRSAYLNCEQGVLVNDPVLAAQLRAIFDHQTDGARAWRVTRENGRLAWSDGNERHASEPNAGWWRRLQAATARLLHLDANL